MSENTYKLVYTFSDYDLINVLLGPLIISVMIIGFLFLKKRISPISLNEGVLTVIALIFILYFMFHRSFDKIFNARDKYNNKTYSISEGEITNFKPRKYKSSYMEEFKVNGRKFVYKDDSYTGCFNHSYGYGGPITHNGQKVKIFHVGNCIVELWVENKNCPHQTNKLFETKNKS